MLSSGKPAERRAYSLPIGRCFLRSSGMPVDLELLPVPPALSPQDSPKITMVWFITLIEAHCSIVEEYSATCREGFAFLQIEQHLRVGWRSSFQPFKRGRETACGTKDFRVIKQGAKSGHSCVSGTAQPMRRGGVDQPKTSCEFTHDYKRIGRSIHFKQFRHDHFRKKPLRMKMVYRFVSPDLWAQHQQNRKSLGATLAIRRGQDNGNLPSVGRDCFGDFHNSNSVTFLSFLSNL